MEKEKGNKDSQAVFKVPENWHDKPVTREENPKGLICESSFAVLFPKYREKYLKECWPLFQNKLNDYGIKSELDLVEGSMIVRTTKNCYDPYAIINGRDAIKLLARGVPYEQAVRVMEDGVTADIIKISSYVRNKEKFVKRRQRLIGSDNQTLKALELLTNCYILVQGHTVSAIGSYKGIRDVRRVVEDCMNNIHPIYSIKTLMIKRELEKDPKLKNESWNRFLPKFKSKNVPKKKPKKRKEKKPYNPFPPAPTKSKVDLELESGQYFLNEKIRKKQAEIEKKQKQTENLKKSAVKRMRSFIPPEEPEIKSENSAKDKLKHLNKRMKILKDARKDRSEQPKNKNTEEFPSM